MIVISQNSQILILLLLGVLCLGTSLFTILIKFESPARKLSLFFLESSTAVLLFACILDYLYEGKTTEGAVAIVNISNFLLFFVICFILFVLSIYIGTLLVGRDGLKTMPSQLRVSRLLSLAGMFIVLIAHVTGIFYSFDENNIYHRGALFPFSFVIPLIVLIIQISIVIKYRRLLSRRIFLSLILFTGLPIISAVVQLFMYGISLLNCSIGIASLVVFCQSLVDQNEFLRKIAYHDVMTGLPNSYGFMSEVGRRLHMGSLVGFNAFYFDISRMAMINRKYGNQTGDEVIKKYIDLIKNQMDKDELLGRLGGNFFVALVKSDRTEALIKMLEGVEIPVSTINGDDIINVSAVAGIYSIEDDDITPQQIVTNVAIAVNYAKNVRKKPYVFMTKELQKELVEVKKTLDQIPKAMKNKEFKPYYQPKVNSSTGKLVGAEALARWEQGDIIIPPVKYIPLMEQNEGITKFDFYMLDYVCSDIEEWLSKGYDVKQVSVNFSRGNLDNENLAEDIHNIIKSHNIPIELIQIEFTETVGDYPLSYLRSVVEKLQYYGISVAIDDFGTGSASIKILKDIPFDVLKIDKSFIDLTDESDKKILKSIIEMARAMGTRLIAEGVEQKPQVEMLKELGCTDIQGFYYDKPLKKTIYEERMKNSSYEH